MLIKYQSKIEIALKFSGPKETDSSSESQGSRTFSQAFSEASDLNLTSYADAQVTFFSL